MRAIEPGEPFPVEYGNGKKLTLYAVSSRQERQMARDEAETKTSDDPEKQWDFATTCLRHYLPESRMSDEDFEALAFDKMNLATLWDVLRKANATTHLTEDDEKKSESPH